MQNQTQFPPLLNDLALDGSYNTLDIGSLAEILTWLRNNTESYADRHSISHQHDSTNTDGVALPKKLTKVHKYLTQIPVDNKNNSWEYVHSFISPDITISFRRLDETIFLVEIYHE